MHKSVLNRIQEDWHDSRGGFKGLNVPEALKVRVGAGSSERERDIAVNFGIDVQVDAFECDLVETGLSVVRQFMESLDAREGKLVN
jgi:hypothetical protein